MIDFALSAFVTLLLVVDPVGLPGRDRGMPDKIKRTVALRAPFIAASILVCMLCFVSANLIARTLGRTGNAVLPRVLGMLLAAYSVQFVINGIAAVRASLS